MNRYQAAVCWLLCYKKVDLESRSGSSIHVLIDLPRSSAGMRNS